MSKKIEKLDLSAMWILLEPFFSGATTFIPNGSKIYLAGENAQICSYVIRFCLKSYIDIIK